MPFKRFQFPPGLSQLPFVDYFQSGVWPNNGWYGPTWYTTGPGLVTNNPPLGAEQITNGGMEAGTPPTGWSQSNMTLSRVADPRPGSGGSFAIDGTINATAFGWIYQTLPTAADTWVTVDYWGRCVTADFLVPHLYTNGFGTDLASGQQLALTTWFNRGMSGRLVGASCLWGIFVGNNVIGRNARADDVSLKPMTLSDLFAVRPPSQPDITIGCTPTCVPGHRLGVILNLDSKTSPANFVICYVDSGWNAGARVVLEKCVSGVYTQVMTGAITYIDFQELKVQKSGTTYKVFYNGSQIGSDQTISDAGVINNTIHGLFCPSLGPYNNYFSSFFMR